MIEAINKAEMVAITARGDMVPITNLADFEGDETDDWAEAIAGVAGPDTAGTWHVFIVADYTGEAH